MATTIVKVPLRVDGEPHKFEPAEVEIATGDTVQWENDDTGYHTVTPEEFGAFPEGTLASQGDTHSHQFASAGEYPYYCQLHGSMQGKVTVAKPGSDD